MDQLRIDNIVDAWVEVTAEDDAYWRKPRTPRYYPFGERKLTAITDITEEQKALYYKAYDSVLETEKKQYRSGA